ncbi:hypothetical protein [Kitasatospora sp. NPDC088783]|uniref:hypothetical protein n=1 Tax=Kitasatospora sp. NPDC088783 TaxID=3364077 RepID=UPI0038163CEB
MDDKTAAIRRVYIACVATRCSKCRVEVGRYCRNRVAGVERDGAPMPELPGLP